MDRPKAFLVRFFIEGGRRPTKWGSARLCNVGLAPDTPFATKLELARRMLDRALATGAPMAWVVDSSHDHSRERCIRLEDRNAHIGGNPPDPTRVREAVVLVQCRRQSSRMST